MYINNFLIKRTLAKTFFVVIIFCTIITMIQILRILPYFSTKGNILDMFYLVLLNIPKYISIALPISFFVATYNTFNDTLTSFEIYAIRNTGLSNWEIFSPIFKISLIFACILFLLFSFVNPIFYYNYTKSKSTHLNTSNLNTIQGGRFNKLDSNTKMFISEKDGNNLKNIFLYGQENNDNEKSYTIISNSAKIQHKKNGLFIAFDQGLQRIKSKNNYQYLTFDKFQLNIDRTSTLDSTRWNHNQFHSYELLQDLNNKNPKLNKNISISHLMKRFIESINIILFSMIAAYTVLSQNLQRNTNSMPIIISTSIVIGITIFSNLIVPLGKKQTLLLIPILLIYCFAFYIIIKKFKIIDSLVKK